MIHDSGLLFGLEIAGSIPAAALSSAYSHIDLQSKYFTGFE